MSTKLGAAHCDYAIGIMKFVSSRRVNFLIISGKAAYDIGRLGRRIGLVYGLSDNVASV